jgi:hypothetical protein
LSDSQNVNLKQRNNLWKVPSGAEIILSVECVDCTIEDNNDNI